MAHETSDPPEPMYPTPMGSLERTVEIDDELDNGLADTDGPSDVEQPADDDQTELDRMIIRLGGNGF